MRCDPSQNGFTTTNDYVLGLGGEQLAEMGVNPVATAACPTAGAPCWQHANVWAGGKLLATYDKDGLHFYFDDPLGTRRAQTDYAGVLEQTCSSLPYGDALNCSGGNLQAPTEHHFTGKERDTESGNDYFMARYYNSNMGRFMSPDWSAKEDPVPYAQLDDPQSLNLYSYVGNNPLDRVDADGHEQGIPAWEIQIIARVMAWGVPLLNRIDNAVQPMVDAGNRIASDVLNPTKNCPNCQIGIAFPEGAGGANILENAAKGKAFQTAVAADKALTDTNVVQNVTIKTESGVKTVMDVVSKDSSGATALTEAKSSATARLTKNQAAAHPEIANTGGTVVGQGKPGFPGGTKIPPTNVNVVRPKVPGQQ